MTNTGTVAMTTQTAPDIEVIIDNPEAELSGTWQTSSFLPHHYGDDYAYARPGTSNPTIRWTPELTTPGAYVVSIWLPDGDRNRSTGVIYRVRHAGSTEAFSVDQTLPGGLWRSLGDSPLQFAADGDEYVELVVNEVDGANRPLVYVNADAVRVATPPEPVDKPPANVQAATGRNYVQLTWQPLERAEVYVIARGVNGSDLTDLATVTNPTGYLDLQVNSGSSFRYTVAGRNLSGIGPTSEHVQVRTDDGAPLQAVPGLRIATSNGAPELIWEPTRDADGYIVQRAARSGGPYRSIARIKNTRYVDVSAPSRTSYYTVLSENAHGPCKLSSPQVAWRP